MKLAFFLLLFVPVFVYAETNTEVLRKVWEIGKAESCSLQMRARFNQHAFDEVLSQVSEEMDREALARALNPFLFSLGYSHTEFFTDQTESFYLFKGYTSLVNPRASKAPLIVNPGVQIGSDGHGYFVRAVLDGFSAKAQGLLVGDRILSLESKPFSGMWGNQAKSNVSVEISRLGQKQTIHLDLLSLNWAQAFQDATKHSVKTIPYKGRTIGYIHFWSAVHPESVATLWDAVRRLKDSKIDGLILDLRDGYGGAFWDHLDPFFKDRNDYFEITATDGEGNRATNRAELQVNPDAYLGPMVVLINGGSRSGKEALAFQFKKTKRALVMGTSTPGYFSGGGMFFVDELSDYFLYLCVMRDSLLDGVPIEGIGVKPDVTVEFDMHNPQYDSQIDAALERLVFSPSHQTDDR